MIDRRRQSGAALFIVLILLLVVTIIGVSSMNDTMMQGKMAGAIQDSNIALQGVESVIREAETYLDGITTTTDFQSNSNGRYLAGSAPDPYAAATWAGTTSLEGAKVGSLAEDPRYFIELIGEVVADDGDTAINVETYSHEANSGTIIAFRIVSRSTGGSGTSQRIVESYYGRMF